MMQKTCTFLFWTGITTRSSSDAAKPALIIAANSGQVKHHYFDYCGTTLYIPIQSYIIYRGNIRLQTTKLNGPPLRHPIFYFTTNYTRCCT